MQAFDGSFVATIFNPETGVPFTMRLVRKGEGYGRNLCLIHDKDRPLVEFYDARHGCDPSIEKAGAFGQFVSRYYVDTFTNTPQGNGMSLEGSVADWTLSSGCVQTACALLSHWTGTHPRAVTVTFERKALEIAKKVLRYDCDNVDFDDENGEYAQALDRALTSIETALG